MKSSGFRRRGYDMIISGTELWVSTEAYHCYPRSNDHFTSVVFVQFLSYAVILCILLNDSCMVLFSF